MSELRARKKTKKKKKESFVILIGLYILKVKPENLSKTWVAGEHQESNTCWIQLDGGSYILAIIFSLTFIFFPPYFSFIVFNMFTESINHKIFQGLFYLYLVKL